MEYAAALYVHGKIVTGTHHGDAFNKLSDKEKNEDICSGFYDKENNKFITDEKEFYLKQIILVRHADAEHCENPGITDLGRSQVQRAATFLNAFVNLSGFKGYASPRRRCQETAEEFSNETCLDFNTSDLLRDANEPHPIFVSRLRKLLKELPDKSFIISHCDFIKTMAYLATGINTDNLEVQNCCILFVDNGSLSKLGNL